MTLIDLLEVWTKRYALTAEETTLLGTEVFLSVQYRGWKHPPMPAPLAHKLQLFTFAEAVRRFLLERLASSRVAAPVVSLSFTQRAVNPPPALPAPELPDEDLFGASTSAPPPVTALHPPRRKKNDPRDANGRVIRRCSVCREVGHRIESCPQTPFRTRYG